MALVLVIDDSSVVRDLVRGMLEHAGHSVVDANDGDAGVRLFNQQRPDLVITDLVMPNKEGIETIREIRQSKSDAKVIAMSGGSSQQAGRYLNAAKKLGADAVLGKPFTAAELLALVRQLLAQSDGRLTGLPEPVTGNGPALDITEPRLHRLYYYWLERKGDRRFPARRDIDPLDFGYVLGDVLLIDVLRSPLRFHVRLHGTTLARRAGYELTGKLLGELPNAEYRDYVIGRCENLVASGAPLVVRRERVIDGRQHSYEALWLPFSDDGSNVTMLLVALIYDGKRTGISVQRLATSVQS